MKKAKILAVFGILLAMGITACNKGGENGGDDQSQETPASQQTSEGGASENTSSTHTHKWNAWAVVEGKEPTCTEPGTERRTCKECDAFEEREKAALGHDWENATEVAGSDTATCTTDGLVTIKCGRAGCNVTKDVESKAHHKYGEPTKVEASGEGKEYMKEVCTVNADHLRLAVNQSQVTYASGSSRKNGTPDGYTKLSSNNQSMSVKFNYDHFALGKLYLFGCMDGYSTDSNKAAGLYYNGSPNVEIKVNGNVVDVSAQRDTKYSDIFGEEAIETGLESPSNYLSHEGYFPIGDIFLQDGVNELVFTRKQTLNMLVKDFVFVIENSTHNHVAATTWSSDETGHWHDCTAPGCPTGKADAVVAHTLAEVAPADDTAAPAGHQAKDATCSEAGLKVRVCSVCGYREETPIAKLPHTLGEPTDVVAATCAAEGSQKRKCSVCDEVITEVLPKLPHNYGDAVENYAAVTEGENQHVAATAHNCSGACNKSALRWSAVDYDVTKTTARSTCEPESRGSGKAVRFGAPKDSSNKTIDGCENYNQDETLRGTHLVYNVNVPADATNVGLAFKTAKRTDQVLPPVFDKAEGDSSKGYEKVNGEWVRPDSRYGLKVDGERIVIEKDTSGQEWLDGTQWYYFPVTIPSLTAGVHEIELYAYGGYRADIYEFELTGLPHVTPSHLHNGEDTWLSDANNHWHACTADGCPIADGIYDKAAHNFVEVLPANDTEEDPAHKAKAASCTEEGIKVEVCSVCNYRKESKIEKLAHSYGEPVVVNPTQDAEGSETYTCTVCGDEKVVKLDKLPIKEWSDTELIAACSATPSTKDYAGGYKGIKASSWKQGDGKSMTISYTSAEALSAKLVLFISIKTSNNDTFNNNNKKGAGFWYNDNNQATPKEKMRITVNGVQVTPPTADKDIDFKANGCTVNDATASDNGALCVPVWIDVCGVELQAAENTIKFEMIDTSYGFYVCGARLLKA